MNRFVILRLSWNLMTDSVLFSLLPSQLWRQMCSTVLAKTKVHECFLINLSWDHLGQGPSLWQTRTLQEGQFRISGQRIQLVPLLFKSSPLTPTWRLSCKHPSLSSFTNWFSATLKRRFKKKSSRWRTSGWVFSWISTSNSTGCTHPNISWQQGIKHLPVELKEWGANLHFTLKETGFTYRLSACSNSCSESLLSLF